MVASGTATVEAASLGMPLVIVYKVAPLTYWVGRAVVRVPFLGMINLLAEREIAREFLQGAARPGGHRRGNAAPARRRTARRARGNWPIWRKSCERLGGGGAAERAADAILPLLEAGDGCR